MPEAQHHLPVYGFASSCKIFVILLYLFRVLIWFAVWGRMRPIRICQNVAIQQENTIRAQMFI